MRISAITITTHYGHLGRAVFLIVSTALSASAMAGGKGERAENDIIALNAGALLMTAGKASTLRDGAAMAREALLAGKAGAVLDAYVEASND